MPPRRLPPTLAAVASACGVSLSTASKALNPHADRCDIGAATRERILAAAVAMGYERDASRSARARRRYGVVGLVWPRHAAREGLYAHLVEALAVALRGLSYRLLITPVAEAEDWRVLQFAQRLDGVVVVERAPEAVLADLEARDWPAVLLNLRTPRRLHQVLVDEAAAAEAVVARLAAAGHRRLAYLGNPEASGHYSEDERLEGVQAAAARHGAGCAVAGIDALDGLAAACAAGRGPTAFISYHYREVPPLLAALRRHACPVPAAASIVCLDEVPWFEHLEAPVAAVALPVQAMAERAAVLVAAMIESGRSGEPGLDRLPGILVERASIAIAPAPPA